MASYRDVLSTSTAFLLVDWPDRDVPDTLARNGFTVTSHDGPGPTEYNAYQMAAGQVTVRRVEAAPKRVDIVYSHRPIDELAGIVQQARHLNARAVWIQSGLEEHGAKDARGCWLPAHESARARAIVESAGLEYFDSPYLADAVRELGEP